MNNNITEDYCSFEVSKLLKEKGFNPYFEYNRCYIEIATNEWKECTVEEYEQLDISIGIGNNLVIMRPTHALAIRWISVNYGKDKVSYLNYSMDSDQIDKELLKILKLLR